MIEVSKSRYEFEYWDFYSFLKLNAITFLGIDFFMQKLKAIKATKLYNYEDEDKIHLL